MDSSVTSGLTMTQENVLTVKVNVEEDAEDISQRGYNPHLDEDDCDSEMSVEKFDDAVAVLTFTATVITIALGFIFNL